MSQEDGRIGRGVVLVLVVVVWWFFRNSFGNELSQEKGGVFLTCR